MNNLDSVQMRRAKLSAEEVLKLQARVSRPRAERDSRVEPIPSGQAGDRAPLSHAQRRQWVLWQIDRTSTAYHLCGGLAFSGGLNVAALETCLRVIVSRHESLRTIMQTRPDGDTEQLVLSSAPLDLERVDSSGHSGQAQRSHVETTVREVIGKPFDLETGPLFRLLLIKTSEDQHQLVVVMHHITADEWSIQIILDEVRTLYIAEVTGVRQALPNPVLRYTDYAVWQRNWEQSVDFDAQLAWWRNYLHGDPSALELFPDRPRNAEGKYRSSTYRFDIDPAVIDGLSRLMRQHGGTLFMAMATALQAVLFRYTGQEIIDLGIPVSNRTRDEVARVVGLFVNTVVLRSRLTGRTCLIDLLLTTRDSVFDVQAHQEIPFDRLVELRNPVRRLERQPLFQVMFNHLKRHQPAKQSWHGLIAERLLFDEPDAQLELGLQTVELHDGKVEACITYATELFEAATIARFANHFRAMLSAIAGDSRLAIADVEMLDEEEIRHLQLCGQGALESPAPMLAHRVFEEWASRRPESVALLLDGRSMTYGELNARANRLAHKLIHLGVSPDGLVGIALDRSFDMVVSVLAVLKAGGAYVSLDPDYPMDRLTYMVRDSGLQVLISQAENSLTLGSARHLKRIGVDDTMLTGYSNEDPDVHGHPDQLAYVIYTSGSTGRPKGVSVSHACLIQHAQTMSQVFGLSASDRVLQFSTLNFDACVEQIFSPLITGASLVLRGPDIWDSLTFHRRLLADQITVVYVTTAYWMVLVQDFVRFGIRSYGALRQLHIGGEAMPPEGLKAWRLAGLGHVKLMNTYGPTEATVTASALDCQPYVSEKIALPLHMPIGFPLSGRQLLVLDHHLALTPVGVPGELHIGGELLARGYLGQSALTAERFIADPFSVSGGRFYRSGDLVRWNAEGRLEYLGRVDHQVKIHGFRIELGEIEAQLLAFHAVKEAIVVAKRGAAGTRLVAYVSAKVDHSVDVDEARRWLEGKLPDYMVPDAISVLDALPVNANGKIDRGALPELAQGVAADYEPPLGEIEVALAGLWCQLLQVARVSRNDNFFVIGGNSIVALRLTARIKVELQVEIPLAEVFRNPSLQSFATRVARMRDECKQPPDRPKVRVSGSTETFISPMQHRLWVTERIGRTSAKQGPAAYNMAMGVRLRGDLDSSVLRQAIEAVIERHEVLRTVYPESDDGIPVAVLRDVSVLNFLTNDIANNGAFDEAELARLFHETADAPFDLVEGPLLRARLIRLGDADHVLMLAIHHINFDGWSESVFLRDLAHSYRALSSGRRADLPKLNIQYTDYAAWHRRRLEVSLPQDTAFWQNYLADAPAVSTLSPDFLRPPSSSNSGDVVIVAIPRSTGDAISELAMATGVSVFVVVFAAFLAQLHRLCDADDLVLGTDVAGRDDPDLENLIGFFVNVVPVRSRWTSEVTFRQWLGRTQTALLHAVDHAHVPFDQIIEHAQLRRGRSYSPLVQMLFVMQNVPRSQFSLEGIDIEVMPATTRTAKFDLAVFVNDGPEGIRAEWVYSTSLYRRETIEQISAAWSELLRCAVAGPNSLMDSLFPFPFKESPVNVPSTPQPEKVDKLGKLKRFDRSTTAARSNASSLVRTSFLPSGKGFPLVVQPVSTDLDAVAWAANNREFIESSLRKHACILFRGFGLVTPQEFEAFAEAMQPGLYGDYGDLPKKQGGRNTYRSTPYPERQMILFHNESAHLDRWPRKQWFFCELPSKVGGATPIVDCREMLRRLPDDVLAEFERKGILYVRTFVPRLDVSWQDFFRTESRDEVESRLASAGIEWRWLDEYTLQTRTRCPAVISHPLTCERVFFNQVQLHHVSCLEAEVRTDLLALLGAERMTRQAFYGDGSPISDATMDVVGQAYEACAVRFEWLPGDVVMLDNMLAAHARDPYEEPRKIVVAMGDMFDRHMLANATSPSVSEK